MTDENKGLFDISNAAAALGNHMRAWRSLEQTLEKTWKKSGVDEKVLGSSRASCSAGKWHAVLVLAVEICTGKEQRQLWLAAWVFFEYWVSQGKKWCDFCKIFIANNPLSIRTHDLGQRHKDSVAKRLTSMRKESAAKDKEQKDAARALEQIEEKAIRSYQKDLASFEADKSSKHSSYAHQKKPDNVKFSTRDGWEHDAASGYYCNLSKGYYYDPNSGLFYSNEIGNWVTEEEAFKTSQIRKPDAGSSSQTRGEKSDQAPGLVVSASLNPMRPVKGAPSSIMVKKRKIGSEKTKVISKEEAEALKAREAAKKRMEEREKPLMGLYRSY